MKRYFKKGKGCLPAQKPDEILPPGDAVPGAQLSTFNSVSDEFMHVPDEIVRNIDRTLDNMAKAQQGLIKARGENTLPERLETDNDQQKEE